MNKDKYSPSAPAEKYEMPSLDEFLSGNLFHPPSGTGPGTRARSLTPARFAPKLNKKTKSIGAKKVTANSPRKESNSYLIQEG